MARPTSPTRRADILAAARDAFNARGFAGARMDDIAAAIGISKATLYLQFASKEALFQALTSELIEATFPEAAPADLGDIAADQLLTRFIATMARRLVSPEMAFVPRVIIGEGMNFPELARFYHDKVIGRGLGIVEAIIRHGVARGEFACADPHLACRTVVGGILLSALWRMVFEPVGAEVLDIEAMARAHTATILDGFNVRKEPA